MAANGRLSTPGATSAAARCGRPSSPGWTRPSTACTRAGSGGPDRMTCAGPGEDFFPDPFWASGAMCRARGRGPRRPVGALRSFAPRLRCLRVGAARHLVRRASRAAAAAAKNAADAVGPHPFYELPEGPGYYTDDAARARLAAACIEGARLRGDLAVRLCRRRVRASRWSSSRRCITARTSSGTPSSRTIRSTPVVSSPTRPVRPDLVEVYREVDRQVGRIVEAAGADTAVMAFSLHGMTVGPGIPTILEPLLEAAGLSAPTNWSGLSWRDRAAVVMGAAKRRAPQRHETHLPPQDVASHPLPGRRADDRRAARLVADPGVLASERPARIRPNQPRRPGVPGGVPRGDYDAMCEHVAEVLGVARSLDGGPWSAGSFARCPATTRRLATFPTWSSTGTTPRSPTPSRGRVGSAEFEAEPIRKEMSGQHTPHGFCILGERLADGSTNGSVRGTDLHRYLLAGLGSEAVSAAG